MTSDKHHIHRSVWFGFLFLHVLNKNRETHEPFTSLAEMLELCTTSVMGHLISDTAVSIKVSEFRSIRTQSYLWIDDVTVWQLSNNNLARGVNKLCHYYNRFHCYKLLIVNINQGVSNESVLLVCSTAQKVEN